MRSHRILEEYGPKLAYIKGENNVVADALSHLEMTDKYPILNIAKHFGYEDEDLPENAYSLRYCNITAAQQRDKYLL